MSQLDSADSRCTAGSTFRSSSEHCPVHPPVPRHGAYERNASTRISETPQRKHKCIQFLFAPRRITPKHALGKLVSQRPIQTETSCVGLCPCCAEENKLHLQQRGRGKIIRTILFRGVAVHLTLKWTRWLFTPWSFPQVCPVHPTSPSGAHGVRSCGTEFPRQTNVPCCSRDGAGVVSLNTSEPSQQSRSYSA